MKSLISGRCYCGICTFTVEINESYKPVNAYCHCDSCKRAHSAPIYQVSYVPTDCFELTCAKENVVEFQKYPGGIERWFCKHCGTRVANRTALVDTLNGEIRIGIFPNLLDSISEEEKDFLKPTLHLFVEEATFPVHLLDDKLQRKQINSVLNVDQDDIPVVGHGKCYCGAVEFEVDLAKVKANMYCHCTYCRQAHSSPIYQISVLSSPDAFKITNGSASVVEYQRNPNVAFRNFCSHCGTRLFNQSEVDGTIGYFPHLLDVVEQKQLLEQNKPTIHYDVKDAVLPLELLSDGIERDA